MLLFGTLTLNCLSLQQRVGVNVTNVDDCIEPASTAGIGPANFMICTELAPSINCKMHPDFQDLPPQCTETSPNYHISPKLGIDWQFVFLQTTQKYLHNEWCAVVCHAPATTM